MQAETFTKKTAWMLCASVAIAGSCCCAEESASVPPAAAFAMWGEGLDSDQGWVSVPSLAAADLNWPTAVRETPLSDPDSSTPAQHSSTAADPAMVVNDESIDSAVAEAPELHGLLRRVAWVTGSLAVAAMLALWFFRAWLTRPRLAARSGRSLQLIESLRIGSRCGVFLVQADQHRVLISIDQGRGMQMVTLPTSFAESLQDDPADSEDVEPVVTRSAPAADPFGGLSSRRLWRMGAST